MNTFLKSNKWQYRLLRTVSQALIGFLMANLDTIVGLGHFSPTETALIVGATMSLLSPLYAWLSKYCKESEEVTNYGR